MSEGIYKYRKDKPKKVYMKPQIGIGNISYASDKKKKYEKPSVSVKMKAKRELAKHDTEVGHSEGLKKALSDVEENTRNLHDEQLHVFDENGNKLFSKQGKGNKVEPNQYEQLALMMLGAKKNIVLTHNHPLSIGKKGFGGIGHSFSKDDMISAVAWNAAEMRAATPTFTFSFKRPKNGWGATPAQVKRAYEIEAAKLGKEIALHEHQRGRLKLIRKGRGWDAQVTDRTDVYMANELNKRVAKRFGWNYTSRQNHPTKR